MTDFGKVLPPPGAYPCRTCGVTLGYPGFCTPCGEAWLAEEHDRALTPALETIPERFRWARLESPELPSRVSIPAPHLARARVLLGRRVVTLSGPSGTGKTSLAAALLRAHIDAGRHPCAEGVHSTARRARFVAARHLGTDSNAPAVAMRASVLLLDDVGSEAGQSYKASDRTQVTADVLSERHDRGLPTIVTTFATWEAWAAMYGDGVARRYLDAADGVAVVRLKSTLGGACPC